MLHLSVETVETSHWEAVEFETGPRLGPGSLIADKYEVEGVVGSGGMGVILAARHRQLGHRVAIKILTGDESRKPESRARFLREARAAAALRSDHVVQIHDVGTLEGGDPFIVMELLEGSDLASVLAERGPLDWRQAVELLAQAAMAIRDAHEVGIIHRDLKPANLFLTERSDGAALIKVLDFGISKALTPLAQETLDRQLTSATAVMGSPSYMAPEQIRDASVVDRRCDLWALGVTFYELVTGRLAFEGDTLPAVCASIAADPPRPLAELAPEVPPGLVAVIERCLRKDREERFASAEELLVALEPYRITSKARVRLAKTQRTSRNVGESTAPEGTAPTIRPTAEATLSGTVPSLELPRGDAHGSATLSRQRRSWWWWSIASAALLAVIVVGYRQRLTSVTREASVSSAVASGPSPLLQATPGDFRLVLDSTPSGAEVFEGGQWLGRTPLSLHIPGASVAQQSRHFELRLAGYGTHWVSQGPAEQDVRLVVPLEGLPTSSTPVSAAAAVPSGVTATLSSKTSKPVHAAGSSKPAATNPPPTEVPTSAASAAGIRFSR